MCASTESAMHRCKQQISSRHRVRSRSNVEIVGRPRRWPADRDITSVADWDQIEPAVIIEAAGSRRGAVFAELFELETINDGITVQVKHRSIQAIRMNAVMSYGVRSREQIGRSREGAAKAVLRHALA